jgi:hypothetical protein
VDVLNGLLRALGMRCHPLWTGADGTLEALRTRAAARTGHAQPDLAGLVRLSLRDPSAGSAASAAAALHALGLTEYVEVVCLDEPPPPPGDIPPTTPLLASLQLYRRSNPGLDADFGWTNGIRGLGIRLSDCEYGFATGHEDLVDSSIVSEPGQTVTPDVYTKNWDEHGTAVLGILAAAENAYGVDGFAPSASFFFYPEKTVQRGWNRYAAVASALAASAAGDIVLLEMQGVHSSGAYVPAEYDAAIWELVRTGTDAGIVVVAAAGNGGTNTYGDLDNPAHAEYLARGNSGAILVGAGSADTNHVRLAFSTYGSRVDVQGWGQSVATAGYGTYARYGNDDNQAYVTNFGGTSAAAAMAAGACVVLQENALAIRGRLLGPAEMRQVLVSSGIAQGPGGHIGPLPDLRAAVAWLAAEERRRRAFLLTVR